MSVFLAGQATSWPDAIEFLAACLVACVFIWVLFR